MIKLSQKRTCGECTALKIEQYTSKCELGYSFDEHFKPIEPCPKPKTFSQLLECRQWYNKTKMS